MSQTNNPEQFLNTSGFPIGSFQQAIYRPTAQPTPPAFPLPLPGNNTGTGASAASATYATGAFIALGIYIFEMFDWKDGSKKILLPTALGADGPKTWVRGEITVSITAQLTGSGSGSYQLRNGDVFEMSPFSFLSGSTPTAAPLARFVIESPSRTYNEGTANKQSMTACVDRQNSDVFWST